MVKSYVAKLPYILLLFLLGFAANSAYYGELRLSQLVISFILANFVILRSDYFCFTGKQGEFRLLQSLPINLGIGLFLSLFLLVMQYLRFIHLSFYAMGIIIMFFMTFPFIVDKSRNAVAS